MKEFFGGLFSLIGLTLFCYGFFRVLMPKEDFGRKKAFWMLVTGFVAMGIGGAILPEEQQTSKEPSNQKKEVGWLNANVTEDAVRAALSKERTADPVWKDDRFPKNITEIEIYDLFEPEGQKKVAIRFKPESILYETDFVRKVGGTAIGICDILYRNKMVEEVCVFAQLEMTDQYGKSELENVIKICITKAIANKIDWNGPDPGNIYRIADNYNIHLGILRNVDLNEVKIK